MSMWTELMQRLMSMQQSAQENLPVIPNNGNPNGVYNNPPVDPNVPTQSSGQNSYPWLNPSPSMDLIMQMLSKPIVQPGGPNVPTPWVGQPQGPDVGTPWTGSPQPVIKPVTPVMPVPNKPGLGNGHVPTPWVGTPGNPSPVRDGSLVREARGMEAPTMPLGRGYFLRR